MASQIYVIILFTIFFTFTSSALPIITKAASPINSNSILVALLDSHYTELSELIEKALLLQTLETAVSSSNITIFAPRNEALERDLDPELKQFLLQPRNLKSLQNLILFHIIPSRIDSSHFLNLTLHPNTHTIHPTLLPKQHEYEDINISHEEGQVIVSSNTKVIKSDDITRPDGVIHSIDRILVPKSVVQEFNARRSLISTSAVIPQGAPEVDPRTHRLKKPITKGPPAGGSPPVLPIYDAMAPGPSIAPAPAPGPGGPHHHFDGETQVKDFIHTLLHYGGYNELADILVNLTSLATEMGRLVSEGYVLTVLAPNDEAMAKLTTEQLAEAGAAEQIMYYHLIPEYQTEESMYNNVRRFGKVKYDTLRLPHKVEAEEADGSVKFGKGEGSAYLFDPDIYTDGRISVQGIDGVLFPNEGGSKIAPKSAPVVAAKVVEKPRRGKLMEMACATMIGAHFSSCL